MTILDEIVAYKKKEVESCKQIIPFEQLTNQPGYRRTCYSLRESLINPSKTAIIAEFKRKSPSKGIINDQSKVEDVTTGYAKAGASALSILTDFNFFGGSLDDVLKARPLNQIPILRKEFIIDAYQVHEAKAMGADAILLIAACLSVSQVQELGSLAHELGLEVLLEIHDASELGHISMAVDIVGVNNRNLKTFEVDLQHSVDLARQIPDTYLKISESGIHQAKDIHFLASHGFKGFLMGERFMKNDLPAEAFARFVATLNPSGYEN